MREVRLLVAALAAAAVLLIAGCGDDGGGSGGGSSGDGDEGPVTLNVGGSRSPTSRRSTSGWTRASSRKRT